MRLIVGLSLAFWISLAGSKTWAGGEDTIFPLDTPIEFPWSSIEGMWQVANSEVESIFSFEVQMDCDSRQTLKVLQIEPATGRLLAEGIGYQNADSKQVYAAMRRQEDGMSFVVFVGAFMDKTNFPPQRVMMLKMSKFTDWTSTQNFRIHQMNKTPARVYPSVEGGCQELSGAAR